MPNIDRLAEIAALTPEKLMKTETELHVERVSTAPNRSDELGLYEIVLQNRIAINADAIVLVRGVLTPQCIDKLIQNLQVVKESLIEPLPTPPRAEEVSDVS